MLAIGTIIDVEDEGFIRVARRIHQLNHPFHAALTQTLKVISEGSKEPVNNAQWKWKAKCDMPGTVSSFCIRAIHIQIYPARRASASAKCDQEDTSQQGQHHAIKPKVGTAILLDPINNPGAEDSDKNTDPKRDQ